MEKVNILEFLNSLKEMPFNDSFLNNIDEVIKYVKSSESTNKNKEEILVSEVHQPTTEVVGLRSTTS